MEFKDFEWIVRVFDEDLCDYDQYKFINEENALAFFKHYYDLNCHVSLRKVSIGVPDDVFIHLPPPIYSNTKGTFIFDKKEN